jgi:geranyl-CoA carboxylase alpha subunit
MPFSKILIANRGEIACRIARTARAMGYRSVAVYSDADAGARHAVLADQAVRIGPPPVRDSYLDAAALLRAAAESGADAVHPGYGFLSETAEFAEACEQAGLTFIGPTPGAIRAMGNKAAAKRLMIEAGVPCVPGYQGADQSDARLVDEAQRIGFPVMVKAAAGGGGRGMRLVGRESELAKALGGARSEASNAFGSGELILEKAVVDARHVEIQVFADAQGRVIHLGERDCSIQRRHQKVVEESPSPAVSPTLRARMGEAAVAAARAIDYRGAGTVEFLLDAAGHFYFLEMNTRLQVEHPVTEAITGLDLVAWQLRVAAGEALPLTQDQVRFQGHAIEVRLYAEDPHRGFLPQSGTVVAWEPAEVPGVRIDHGLLPGQSVSPYYDPMLAKVIAHGASREEARRRLILALEDTLVLGLNTNRMFLTAMLRHPAFIAGEATTGFIGEHFAPKSAAMQRPPPDERMLALAAVLLFEATAIDGDMPAANWRSAGAAAWPLRLAHGGTEQPVQVTCTADDAFEVAVADRHIAVHVVDWQESSVRFTAGDLQQTARYAFADGALHLDLDGVTASFRETLFATGGGTEKDGDARLLAPMNGRIVAVLAKAGDKVSKGQRVIVLEAMKMQHEIAAGRSGTIERIAVKEGDQVATRQLLAALVAEGGSP